MEIDSNDGYDCDTGRVGFAIVRNPCGSSRTASMRNSTDVKIDVDSAVRCPFAGADQQQRKAAVVQADEAADIDKLIEQN